MELRNGIPIFQEKTFTYHELYDLSDVGTKEHSHLEKIFDSITQCGVKLSMEQIVDLMEYKEQSEFYFYKMEQELRKETGITGKYSTDYFGFLNKVFDYLDNSDKPFVYVYILSEIAWCVASEISVLEKILNYIKTSKQSDMERVQSLNGLGAFG